MHVKKRRRFEEVDESGDFKQYQNDLQIWLLKAILIIKKKLIPQDIKNTEDSARVFSQEDLGLIAKNWCFLRKLGDYTVNNPKCCLTQLRDARDLERDAVELAFTMQTYIELRINYQPEDKRFQIIDNLRNIFTTRSDEEVISKEMSTFPGFFQVLGMELNEIDQLICDITGQPGLELFLREMSPRVVLKIKKYYEDSSLGYDECQFCNSCEERASDIKLSKYVPCFKSPEKLESFLTLRFRRIFYTQLRDFLSEIDRFFSDDEE